MNPEYSEKALPLEAQLRLRQIELQLDKLNETQLRQCAKAAWEGWMLERYRVKGALINAGIDLTVRAKGFTPYEVCRIDG